VGTQNSDGSIESSIWSCSLSDPTSSCIRSNGTVSLGEHVYDIAYHDDKIWFGRALPEASGTGLYNLDINTLTVKEIVEANGLGQGVGGVSFDPMDPDILYFDAVNYNSGESFICKLEVPTGKISVITKKAYFPRGIVAGSEMVFFVDSDPWEDNTYVKLVYTNGTGPDTLVIEPKCSTISVDFDKENNDLYYTCYNDSVGSNKRCANCNQGFIAKVNIVTSTKEIVVPKLYFPDQLKLDLTNRVIYFVQHLEAVHWLGGQVNTVSMDGNGNIYTVLDIKPNQWDNSFRPTGIALSFNH